MNYWQRNTEPTASRIYEMMQDLGRMVAFHDLILAIKKVTMTAHPNRNKKNDAVSYNVGVEAFTNLKETGDQFLKYLDSAE